MEKTIIKLGDIKIKKQKFHQYKRPISIDNIGVDKTVAIKKVSLDKNRFKYFIGYKDTKKIGPLLIFLQKMSAYKREFHNTKCMNFLIKDDKIFLKRFLKIWEKVTNTIYKVFDSNTVYNEKYIESKKKFITKNSAQISMVIKYLMKI